VVGSQGNDILKGETLDYSNFDRAVKFSISQKITTYTFDGVTTTYATNEGIVNKGNFGKDKLTSFQKIIGAANQENTLDASTAANGVGIDLNLATNSLNVNIPNVEPQKLAVINFINAIGTKNNDTIVGSNADSKLTGGGGNDTITGGTGNDRITGTNSNARGVGEVDNLTGGGGKDKFILGNANGAYYLGNGSNDYATITDFNIFQDSIDVGSLKNYSLAFDGTNTIDLFSGKNVNNRDLIAKIQLADLGLAASKGTSLNNKSTMASILDSGASTGSDPIFDRLNILSGDTSTADAVI
jgi:hypothetical protein